MSNWLLFAYLAFQFTLLNIEMYRLDQHLDRIEHSCGGAK